MNIIMHACSSIFFTNLVKHTAEDAAAIASCHIPNKHRLVAQTWRVNDGDVYFNVCILSPWTSPMTSAASSSALSRLTARASEEEKESRFPKASQGIAGWMRAQKMGPVLPSPPRRYNYMCIYIYYIDPMPLGPAERMSFYEFLLCGCKLEAKTHTHTPTYRVFLP